MHNVDGLAKRFGIDHEEYEQIKNTIRQECRNDDRKYDERLIRAVRTYELKKRARNRRNNA